MLNAVVSYILEAGAEQDIATAMRWLSGSLNGVRLSELYPSAGSRIDHNSCNPGLLQTACHAGAWRRMAAGLGVSPDRVRFILMTGSVLLIATATAATGPIAFVSFLAGPIANALPDTGPQVSGFRTFRSRISPALRFGGTVCL